MMCDWHQVELGIISHQKQSCQEEVCQFGRLVPPVTFCPFLQMNVGLPEATAAKNADKKCAPPC